MAADYGRQRIALLALAFDASGREVVEELARRSDVPRSHLHGFHAAVEDGEAGAIEWLRYGGGMEWSAASWSPTRGLVRGLEAAVQEALDVDRWRAERRDVDFLDLVVFRPAEGVMEASLPPDLLPALREMRRRFRRIARVLLFAAGRFETFGEAAPQGLLHPLPWAGDPEGELFDLVLLQDRINVEGMVVNDPEERRKQAAGMLAHLTVGELAPVLYRRIQAEQARLGSAGRYVTLGLADWSLTRERSIEANAGLLGRRMMARLLEEVNADPVRLLAGAEEWVEEVGGKILAEPPKPLPSLEEDPTGLLATWEESGEEALRSHLRSLGWSFAPLRWFLERRLAALRRVEAQSSAKLAAFMDRPFSRWYMEYRLKGQQYGPPTITRFEEWTTWKVFLLAASGLACLTSIGVAIETPHVLAASIAAGVAGLGAVLLVASGLKKTTTLSSPGSPVPGLLPELNYRRNRNWLAKQLAERCRAALESWDANRERLARVAEQVPAPPETSFPFSEEVCATLQEERSIHPAECLHRFWESEPRAFAGAIGKVETGLADLLIEFARNCCEPLANLEWEDVLQAIGGGEGLADPIWRESLEKARAGALPWLPVAGASGQTFLALPRSLSAELRAALDRHFPGRKVVEEVEGDAILVLQLSQGYEMPAEHGAHVKV